MSAAQQQWSSLSMARDLAAYEVVGTVRYCLSLLRQKRVTTDELIRDVEFVRAELAVRLAQYDTANQEINAFSFDVRNGLVELEEMVDRRMPKAANAEPTVNGSHLTQVEWTIAHKMHIVGNLCDEPR